MVMGDKSKMKIIQEIVNSNLGVTQDEIEAITEKTGKPSRKREFVEAKQLFCFFTKKYAKKISYSKIGEFTGCSNYDHATVISSIKSIKNLLSVDMKIVNIVSKIDDEIRLAILTHDSTENEDEIQEKYTGYEIGEIKDIWFKNGFKKGVEYAQQSNHIPPYARDWNGVYDFKETIF